MSTLEPPVLRGLASDWDNEMDYGSAAFAGIVGDDSAGHATGYHRSIEDQGSNYSTTRPNDKAPPGNWRRNLASAIDMSMSTDDMVKCWNRVYACWLNRANDPRARYINAFNGWNGTGEAERLDFDAGVRTVATPDHKWHSHKEIHRRWANDPEMRRAVGSVLRGESVAQYLGTEGRSTESTGGSMAKTLIASATGRVYLCDGTWIRFIGMKGSGEVAGYGPSQAGQPSLLGPFGNNGQVAEFGTPDAGMAAFGRDVDAPALSPATIAAMAASIADKVIAADNPLTPADLEAVTAAAQEGIEHAVANLDFTTETHAIVIPTP